MFSGGINKQDQAVMGLNQSILGIKTQPIVLWQ